MIGRTISHYEILEKLGEGGMGVVYRARDTKLDRIVAIKFLPPHLSADPEAVKRFVHEAKTASALDHPNICTIHEIDETEDNATFIVMSCYEGHTLRDMIDDGPIEIDKAVDISSQISSGLAKAHENGIVHRDIKPQNILLTRGGEAKIIDFGLAKLAGRTKLTRDGSTLGTAAYMSPEQARGEEVDHRSDIFSLGTILYEMLAGEPPFKGEHEAAMLYGIVHEEPGPVSDRCKDLPAELCAVVERALKKDAGERYQSAAEMKGDLKDFQAGSTSQTGMRTSSRGGGRSSRKNLWIGIAAVAVITVVVGYLMKTGREPAPLTAAEMSLAVVDFRAISSSVDTVTCAMLNEYLNTSLIESCPIRVQSPEWVRECRRRLFGSANAQIEYGQELEIARESKATYVLTGRIGILDDERIINWRLIDVTSGDGLGGGKVESGKLSLMVDEMVGDVIVELAYLSGDEESAEQVPVEQITTASPSAYEHYILGRLRVSHYRGEEALKEFEMAVVQDSTFALVYLEMAWLYFGGSLNPDIALARKYSNAARRFEHKLGIRDRLRLDAFQYGLDYKVTREMATLREMLERWPDDKEVLRIMEGRAYWWWYFDEVIETAKKAWELYPNDPSVVDQTLAGAYRAIGKIEESFLAARSYLKMDPENPNGWDELALSYLAKGMPDSAEIAYRKALNLDPDWGKENLAYCAYHAGDLRKAISIFENILSRDDLSSGRRLGLMYGFTHIINLTALYYEAGRYPDAVRIINEAWQYVGDDPSFWQYQAGMVFSFVGLADKALAIAHEMERSDEIRSRIFAYRFKGLAQVATGDLAGAGASAIRTHEWAETVGPMMSHCAYTVDAAIALSKKDPSSALAALEGMKKITVGFGGMLPVNYRVMLAEAYHMDGDLEEAVVVNRETLRIYGGHALSHYELGKLYEELGQPGEAREHYTKFLEMWKNADEGLPQPEHARERLAALKGA